jgi:hypothetical protein
MTTVDINGLDKVQLLLMLWNNAAVASFFEFMPQSAPVFDETEANTVVEQYIDYFCGRCIKTDISGDTADPWSYDRNAGTGTFQRVVDKMRAGKADKADDKKKGVPKGYKCPDGSGNNFRPFGEAMLPGDPGTVLCGNCPMWLKQHIPYY